jgi:hypothetical protein
MQPLEPKESRVTGWILLATLVAGLLAAVLGRNMPAPLPADAAPEQFAAGRAHALVAEIARAPHPAASEELARVREVLLAKLRALGLEPEEQHGQVKRIALTNLLVRIPGTAPTGTLLCLAHYDSVPSGPGAGDDSVGVAAWLEAFRALRARGWQPRNDVVLLLTDGEELGLFGAYLFGSEHPLMESVACVINLEAIGNGGPAVLFQLGRENGACVRAYAEAVAAPTGTSLGDAVYRRMSNDTDLTVFLHRGIPGFNFALASGSPAYHAPHDTPENLDPASLQHMGEGALELAEHLGDADLRALAAPDVTFFDLLGYGIVSYSKAWDGFLALLALALAVLLCVRARASPRALLEHVLRHLLEIALAAAGIALSWQLLDGAVAALTPEPDWIPGNTTSGGLLFAGAVTLAAAFELRRAGTPTGSAAERPGAIALVWSFAALASLRWLSGAGFVFTWPVLLAALAAPSLRGPRPSRADDARLVLGFAGALVLGLPILHLLLQLFQRAPGPALAMTSTVLVSAVGLFAPAFQRMRRDVPGAARVLLGAGAAALLAAVLVARVLAWRQGAWLP